MIIVTIATAFIWAVVAAVTNALHRTARASREGEESLKPATIPVSSVARMEERPRDI
jgi:hypothetical protein